MLKFSFKLLSLFLFNSLKNVLDQFFVLRVIALLNFTIPLNLIYGPVLYEFIVVRSKIFDKLFLLFHINHRFPDLFWEHLIDVKLLGFLCWTVRLVI